MRFHVAWDPAALFVFYQLPLHSAKLADRAVIRFAERGEGQIEWVAPYYRLRAGFHDVVLTIDREARMIAVLRIYRART